MTLGPHGDAMILPRTHPYIRLSRRTLVRGTSVVACLVTSAVVSTAWIWYRTHRSHQQQALLELNTVSRLYLDTERAKGVRGILFADLLGRITDDRGVMPARPTESKVLLLLGPPDVVVSAPYPAGWPKELSVEGYKTYLYAYRRGRSTEYAAALMFDPQGRLVASAAATTSTWSERLGIPWPSQPR